MQLGNTLFLNRVAVPSVAPVMADPAITHIFIGDISGSMSDSLSKMRTQLKLKLPTLVGERDTVTIIVFSGRSQVYTICEDMPVRTMKDLSELHDKIDRFVRPVGLTGFKEPLQAAAACQQRISTLRPDAVFSLFFMSDGFDNQWSKSEILTAAQSLNVHSATVVEYGYYADRKLLSEMASVWGGELVYAENFDRYAPAFEIALQKRVNAAPKQAIKLQSAPLFGVAFGMDADSLYTFKPNDNGEVLVPPHLPEVFYLGAQQDGFKLDPLIDEALYAALSVFATRMQPKIMYAILRKLGDVAFIRQFQACFGKTRYGDFQEAAKEAVFNRAKRFIDGYDLNAVPSDNIMTVLELLELLADDKSTRLLLDDPQFVYKRIGRKRESAATTITDTEKAKLRAAFDEALDSGDPAKLAEVQAAIDAVSKSKVELKFEALPEANGYPTRGIKYSSTRANVTMGVTKRGYVDVSSLGLTSRILQQVGKFATRIYRDYALVKDGIVNVPTLPVQVSDQTIRHLHRAIAGGRLPASAIEVNGYTVILHLDQLPVINQAMVESASATDLITMEYQMYRHQANRKVYKYFLDLWYPADKGADFAELYGPEDAAKLVAAGITPSGFNPKSVAGEASDVYMAKELKVSLAGLSSHPKVTEAIDALDGKGKATPAKSLMFDAINIVRSMPAPSPEHPDWADKALLELAIEKEDEAVQALMAKVARIKCAIVIGQTWFVEAGDEGMEVEKFSATIDGVTVNATITQREIEVEI